MMRRATQSADAQQAVASGIDVSAHGLGATASALDAELAWRLPTDSASDAESELRSALALPPGTQLELVAPESRSDSLLTLDALRREGARGEPRRRRGAAPPSSRHSARRRSRARTTSPTSASG